MHVLAFWQPLTRACTRKSELCNGRGGSCERTSREVRFGAPKRTSSRKGASALPRRYFIPIIIELPPTSGSMRISSNPASRIQSAQSDPE